MLCFDSKNSSCSQLSVTKGLRTTLTFEVYLPSSSIVEVFFSKLSHASRVCADGLSFRWSLVLLGAFLSVLWPATLVPAVGGLES